MKIAGARAATVTVVRVGQLAVGDRVVKVSAPK